MADTKSKAQRLADDMLNLQAWNRTGPKRLMEQAAAELRRLDAVVDGLNRLNVTHVQENVEQLRQILALTDERDALRAEVERMKTAAGRPPAST